MSANTQIVTILLVLAVAAAALRIATGPIVQLKDGDTLYAMAKSGPVHSWTAEPVELAISDARPAR
jgi:hypothetical protein